MQAEKFLFPLERKDDDEPSSFSLHGDKGSFPVVGRFNGYRGEMVPPRTHSRRRTRCPPAAPGASRAPLSPHALRKSRNVRIIPPKNHEKEGTLHFTLAKGLAGDNACAVRTDRGALAGAADAFCTASGIRAPDADARRIEHTACIFCAIFAAGGDANARGHHRHSRIRGADAARGRGSLPCQSGAKHLLLRHHAFPCGRYAALAVVVHSPVSDPIRLQEPLEPGVYPDAQLTYACFRMDEALTPLNGAQMELTLRVE